MDYDLIGELTQESLFKTAVNKLIIMFIIFFI